MVLKTKLNQNSSYPCVSSCKKIISQNVSLSGFSLIFGGPLSVRKEQWFQTTQLHEFSNALFSVFVSSLRNNNNELDNFGLLFDLIIPINDENEIFIGCSFGIAGYHTNNNQVNIGGHTITRKSNFTYSGSFWGFNLNYAYRIADHIRLDVGFWYQNYNLASKITNAKNQNIVDLELTIKTLNPFITINYQF